MNRFRSAAASICLTAAVASLPLQVPTAAQARMISTDEVIAEQEDGTARGRVDEFLARSEVRRELARFGVSPDEARQRVAALSDDEVRQLAGHLDDMPAGGDALGVIVGAALLIFIVLLITDIAGLTKVFPWTRSVR